MAIKREEKDTYRMISGGSCCQDLFDNFPLYWEVGVDIRAVYASVARVVTLITQATILICHSEQSRRSQGHRHT